MAVGVVNPTIPVANDIILGEFNAYINYGLPTETLLGATRGGCKLDIERDIRDLKSDGTYGYQLDTNGVPMVRYNKLVGKITIENLYLKYFNRKVLCSCETDDPFVAQDWALTGGTYTAETTIVNEGSQSAKCVGDTQAYGIHKVFASVKNLNVFDNSEVSGTGDYITFSIYATTANITALGATSVIRFSIHKDAVDTLTNYFYFDINDTDLTPDCWTTFKILKSAFTEAGTASWTAVTGISFQFATGSPDSSCTFYVDTIGLLQSQTNSAIVPINGGGFKYTDATTHRLIVPSLELLDADYLENVTLVGQRLDGKKIKIVLKNCLNDGNISLALQEKDEVVNSTQFTGHYKLGAGTVAPIELYEHTV